VSDEEKRFDRAGDAASRRRGGARRRKREGKITRIDQSAQVLSVQGEKGDQWDVYLTETTKFEHGLTLAELKIGDQIEFEYVERDGKVWATEIEREKKAD
jgi:hypothetical protein